MTATRWTRTLSLTATAAVTLAVLAGCGDDEPTAQDPAPTESSSGGTSSPSPTASAEPSATSTPDSGKQTTVPAYFVGDTPQGARLYREFRQVPADDALTAAARLVTTGDALDPDYRTLFPGGELASVEYADGRFVATLADDGWRDAPSGMSKQDAELAVQQLVHTLQGVQQERAPLEVVLDGSPTTLLGVDTAGGVTNADQLSTLALVNVTSPAEGARTGDTITASGVASSFEATVPWEVRRGDEVVLDGFATAEGWMDRLYPWEVEVDLSGLEPGEYTFVARTDDPSGGAEGNGPTEDTKTINVG
ncbi:Gmad2 immunoglobulin-like domain-containing protein [Nocardioides ochotonae]|uniref:Gmad2 immunoglobulin-like domain-containing protein n=1 Tax=Nocardioides ochotonae TaxID=2685869 RepID=UPI00140B584E|nr:Gmad2 immunoglobulin-like domain-containing protein [Nocardioides ochotonae]